VVRGCKGTWYRPTTLHPDGKGHASNVEKKATFLETVKATKSMSLTTWTREKIC